MWKSTEYEWYEINKEWQIRNKKWQILKWRVNWRWYLQVEIKRNNKSIHRLVAEAFIPNPDNKPEVNHKDGNKYNNFVENLERCTKSENTIHAFKNWLRKSNWIWYNLLWKNIWNTYAKWRNWKLNWKSKSVIREKNWVIEYFDSIRMATKKYWYDSTSISKCCLGKKWYKTAYWYIWKYV